MINFKLWEAIYPGMVGIMELMKFEQKATPADKQTFYSLLQAKKHKEAKEHLEKVMNFKFQ
jgi:hypothetical protein